MPDFHPLANLFPMMTDAEINDLGDDMLEHGQRKKIMLFEGMILDGRNRYRACLLKGIEPRIAEFMGGEDALAYVMSMNLMRRNMTAGQRAMTVAMAYPEPGVRGKKSSAAKDVPSGALSQARTVLADSRAVAEDVLNGVRTLENAYDAVLDRRKPAADVAVSPPAAATETVPDEQEEQPTPAADTPADAVKAAADRAATKTPKPAPDVMSAADRAEPNDEPDEDEYEDTSAGRRRKARHARESKQSADDLFESLAATGKLTDKEKADYRERGIMPAWHLSTTCGIPLTEHKPDAVAPSDDQRKAALRVAVVNDNVVAFVPKADDGEPIIEGNALVDGNGSAVDITDHNVGAHAINGAMAIINLAQTTPEVFWMIFGTVSRAPDALERLDSAILKLAAIKAAQPEGGASESSS
jgi:hypothetical protein